MNKANFWLQGKPGRGIGAFLVVLSLVLAGTACSPPEPIRIGFIGGTSGRGADLGIAGRDGAQLAIERCNQQGGISGRSIELLIKDDAQDPETARKAVEELAARGVEAIIGPMTSDMGLAVTPVVNRQRIVTVSPTVTTEELTGKDDYFFRVTSTTRIFATTNARFQLREKRMRRVGVIYDLGNRTFTENWLRQFRQAFEEGGGSIVAQKTFLSGKDTSSMDLAKDLLTNPIDGILIIANSMDSALLCQQIRKLNNKLPITLADWGATERLLELGGRAVEGVTVVQTFDRNSSHPSYVHYRKTYLDRFKREPGFPGVYAFDSANVILEALSRRKRGQSLKEALLTIREFKGVQSHFSFDDFGDVRRAHVSMSVVKNGQFVVIE